MNTTAQTEAVQEEIDYHQEAVDKVEAVLRGFNARFRFEVLSDVIKEPLAVCTMADELLAMEPQIRQICHNLDAKAKCIIGVVEEIAAVDGMSVGVKYGQHILYESEFRGADAITETCQRLADDPDIKVLAKAYELAEYINQSE